MANGFHISLPRQDSYQKKQASSRRAPLTPSTVTPPSVNPYTSPVARRDSYGSDSSRATTLLAKVASHSTSPRRTPVSSPVSTPLQEAPQHVNQAPRSEHWRSNGGQDAAKNSWSNQRQQDGYISFPDYEKYWSSGYEQERPRDRSSAKT